MKKKTILLIVSLFFVIALFSVYKYAYQPHRDIASEKSDFTISATQLSEEFVARESESIAKYQDKIIEIQGQVSEILSDSILILSPNVICGFLDVNLNKTIVTGDNLNCKCRLVGYDSLLEEIRIDQCTLTTIIE